MITRLPKTTQQCIRCNQTKPLALFPVNNANKYGHGTRCTVCANSTSRAHHLARIQRVEDYLHHLMSIPICLSTIRDLEQRTKCRDVIRHAGQWMMRALPRSVEIQEEVE